MNQRQVFLFEGIIICALLISSHTAASQHQSSASTAPQALPPVATEEQPTDNIPSGPVSDALPGGTSYPLQEGQCELGMPIDNQSENPSDFAESDKLYIDVTSAAACSGMVTGWEICYQRSGEEASTFDLYLLNRIHGGYQVRSAHTVNVEQIVVIEEFFGGVSCVYVAATENVIISHGDFLGFICNNDIRTGFIHPEQSGSSNSLLVYNLSSDSIRDQAQKRLTKRQGGRPLQLDIIPSSKLYTQDLVPQFRIVINESEPSQTPSTPCDSDSGQPTTIWTTLFTSVVIASVVVIFVLFIMVCLMGCCLCQAKCKCCRSIMRCSRCCHKRKVVHRITVEPITEQSMQYNDTYVPRDPTHIITGGRRYRADIHENPAYGSSPDYNRSSVFDRGTSSSQSPPETHNITRTLPSQDGLSTATELSMLDQYGSPRPACNRYQPESTISESFAKPMDSPSSEMDLDMDNIFEDSREFDHTYETIQSGKFVQAGK